MYYTPPTSGQRLADFSQPRLDKKRLNKKMKKKNSSLLVMVKCIPLPVTSDQLRRVKAKYVEK